MPNIRVTVNNPSPQRISVDQQTRTGVRQIGITSDATLAAGTVQSVSLATSEGLSQSGSPITVSGTITITANQASTSQTGIVRLQDTLLSLNTNQALTANMGYYLSTLIQGKVQNTVSISTGNGLAGGGDLTTNRTITANDASVTTNGIVRLNDTIVSTNTFQAATANAVNAVQRGVASANAAAAAAAQVAAAIRSGTVNSVTVAASTGLLSSGSPITDSGTITLSANDASISVNGIVRLTDVVTSSNTYGAATPNSVNTVHRIAVFANTLVSTVNTALYTVRSGTVNSVAVSTGTGLSSSGSPITDSGTISISANDASTTVNGVVRLNDTLSSSNTNQALTANMGRYITQLLVGKLSNTRFINTTSPLAGGAALDTNPTITISMASRTTNGETRLEDTVTSQNVWGAATPNTVNTVHRIAVFANTLAASVNAVTFSIRSGTVNSVTVAAGTGLISSGSPITDSGTITLSANDASITVNGIVRLNDTLTSSNLNQALTANMGGYITQLMVGKVQNTDIFAGSTTRPGLVPANNAGNGMYVLTAAGTWVPPGSGGGGGSGTVTSVSIIAGSGLSQTGSAITVSGSYTISANDASLTQNGIVRLNDTVTSSNTNQAATANMIRYLVNSLTLSNTGENLGIKYNGGYKVYARTYLANDTIQLPLVDHAGVNTGNLTPDRTYVWRVQTQATGVQFDSAIYYAYVRADGVPSLAYPHLKLNTVNTNQPEILLVDNVYRITSNHATPYVFTVVTEEWPNDTFFPASLGPVGYTPGSGLVMFSPLKDGLPIQGQGAKVWNEYNQGPDSNLHADLLDTYHANAFANAVIANSRTISTGNGLLGGGPLSGNLTITANDASISVNGIVRLNDTLTSSNLNQALTANMGGYLTQLLVGKLSNTRFINTTSPLSGGAALDTNPTIAIAMASVSTNGETRLNDTVTSQNVWGAATPNSVNTVHRIASFANALAVQANAATFSIRSGTVNSVAVAAGTGLVSSGSPITDSGTISISANDASISVNGVVRLNDTLSSANLNQALTANMGGYITQLLVGKVQNTRTISTTGGALTGGGTLAADLSLTIANATTEVNGVVRLNDTVTSSNIFGAATPNSVNTIHRIATFANTLAVAVNTAAFAIRSGTVNSVSVAAGTGLVSSGSPVTDSGSISISANDASISVNGVVRLNDTLSSANLNQALTANMGGYITQLLVGKVQNTRSISTVGGAITGGGTLASDLTLTIANASTTLNGVVRLDDTIFGVGNNFTAATANVANILARPYIGTYAGLVPANTVSNGTYFLRSDGQWVPGTGGGGGGTVLSVTILAGSGLSQTGSQITTSGTYTISANDASTSQNGVVRLQDSLASQNLGQALTANMGFYITQQLVGKVQNTRTISTTSPLTGGGDLSTDRTLAIQAATLTQNGEVRLQDSLTSPNTFQALTANMGVLITSQLVGKVQNTRTVATAGGALQGGGDLTADRTLFIANADINTNGVVRLNDTLTSSNLTQALTANMGGYITQLFVGKVQNTRSVSTVGGALTGGGTLAADLTLTVANATTEVNGVVRLNDTVTSTNTNQAATPRTVKLAYDTAAAVRSGTVNSVTIIAGSGLAQTGSAISDSGTYTISANAASISVNGVVRLNDTLTSANLGQALTANMGGYITQLLVGKVQNTTTVSTTSPLAGGGALSSSLTLSIQAAGINQNGEVRLNDTLSSANLGQALTANMGGYITQLLVGKVQNTRSVSTTGGALTGGGTLASDLTLTVANATTEVNGVVRLNDTLSSSNTNQALTANMGGYITQLFVGKVQNTRSISTVGGALTGGGTLAADLTLTIANASTTVNGVVRLNDTLLGQGNTTQAATANIANILSRAFNGTDYAGLVPANNATTNPTGNGTYVLTAAGTWVPQSGGGGGGSGTVTSVSIIAGSGLSQTGSAITTSGSYTITANDASTSVNGVVRLQDSLASANLGQALTANMGAYITQLLVGKVQNTTTVSTTSPLAGGGALSSSLTLSIQAAGINQNGEVRLNDTLSSANLGQALTANMGGYITQLFVGKVQNTRSVSTVGGALTGGGTLAADLTLTVANATTEVNGVVRLNDTVASLNLNQALTANMGRYIVQSLLPGKVQNTFSISTTSPLTGGGDLTTNRTIAIQAAGINQNGEVRLNDTLSSANLGQALTANMGGYITQLLVGKVQNTVSISTVGGALTGGGTLATSLSLTIANATPEVNGVVRLNDTLLSTNTNQALTANQGRALARIFSATYDGLVPTPGASTGRLLRDDATWVTVSGTGTVTSVDITPTEGILSTGGPITGAGAITIGANNFTATANGFVPKSVTADGTKYLRDDGTWQTVSASSGSSDFDYGMAIAVNRGYFL